MDFIYSLALGKGPSGWLNLGINLFLSTLVGGIVLLIIIEILAHEWAEFISPANAFIVVFLVNVANFALGSLGLLGALSFIPMAGLVVPLLIWILLVKVFFWEMELKHTVIIAVIGFVLSVFLVPFIVNNFIMGFFSGMIGGI